MHNAKCIAKYFAFVQRECIMQNLVRIGRNNHHPISDMARPGTSKAPCSTPNHVVEGRVHPTAAEKDDARRGVHFAEPFPRALHHEYAAVPARATGPPQDALAGANHTAGSSGEDGAGKHGRLAADNTTDDAADKLVDPRERVNECLGWDRFVCVQGAGVKSGSTPSPRPRVLHELVGETTLVAVDKH